MPTPQKISIFLSFILFSSCQNLDNFDVNTVKKPQIILQARLVARQVPSIYVSKLWGATAPRPKETFYRDADVELFEENRSVGKLFLKDSMYVKSDYIIKANTRYIIKVSVEGLPKVESEPVLIPADVEITKTSFDKNPTSTITRNGFWMPCLVSVSFKINEKIAGYGVNVLGFNKEGEQLKCYNENLDLGERKVLIKSPCTFETYNVNVDPEGKLVPFTYDFASYLSRCVGAPEKTVPVMVESKSSALAYPFLSNYNPKSQEANRLIVCITAVSDEVIQLSKTARIIEGATAALSEPYPTYSNIKGGLGIVTGFNVGYKVLIIK